MTDERCKSWHAADGFTGAAGSPGGADGRGGRGGEVRLHNGALEIRCAADEGHDDLHTAFAIDKSGRQHLITWDDAGPPSRIAIAVCFRCGRIDAVEAGDGQFIGGGTDRPHCLICRTKTVRVHYRRETP